MTTPSEDPTSLYSHKRAQTVTMLIAAMGVVFTLTIVGWVYLYFQDQEGDRADDHRSHQLAQLVDAIQKERIKNIRAACEDQNERHDRTVARLDRILDEAFEKSPTPEMKARVEASRASTVFLINALAPVQDCDKLVENQTGRTTTLSTIIQERD